jgi:hypothetical protein
VLVAAVVWVGSWSIGLRTEHEGYALAMESLLQSIQIRIVSGENRKGDGGVLS